MQELTKRQQEILEFIQASQVEGVTPTMREIARHFGFSSMTAARDHIQALQKKGYIEKSSHAARMLRVLNPLSEHLSPVSHIPIFGSIPAGRPVDARQEAVGCVSVDVGTLGFKPSARTFALQVRGDSMIGRHIVEGDIVILEHGKTPREGDVVAALIDSESTLKTFVVERGKPFLKAENPRYSKIHPAQELVIQGVMVGLIRRQK